MYFRKAAILILGINFNLLCLSNVKPALAFQLTLTEMTTDEGFIYDNTTPTYTPSSSGFNSVTEFKVEDSSSSVQTYTIGSGTGESDFVALEATGVDVPYVIQPRGSSALSTTTDFLLPNQEDYLSAGTNGLSLSTGINKVNTQDQEIFTFPVLTVNTLKVNDGIVDFFIGDIAQNQSPDKWELLANDGSTIASLTPTTSDWQKLGRQNVERVSTTTGLVDTDTGTGFYSSPRDLSGLALELSDFVLDPAFGSGQLTSTQASSIDSMRISIGETPTTDPKTDYSFFAADRASITFDVGTSNMAQVPFEFSPAFGLLFTGLSIALFKIRLKLILILKSRYF